MSTFFIDESQLIAETPLPYVQLPVSDDVSNMEPFVLVSLNSAINYTSTLEYDIRKFIARDELSADIINANIDVSRIGVNSTRLVYPGSTIPMYLDQDLTARMELVNTTTYNGKIIVKETGVGNFSQNEIIKLESDPLKTARISNALPSINSFALNEANLRVFLLADELNFVPFVGASINSSADPNKTGTIVAFNYFLGAEFILRYKPLLEYSDIRNSAVSANIPFGPAEDINIAGIGVNVVIADRQIKKSTRMLNVIEAHVR